MQNVQKKQTLSKHLVKTSWGLGAPGRTGSFGEKENIGPALQGPSGVLGQTGLELNAAVQRDL